MRPEKLTASAARAVTTLWSHWPGLAWPVAVCARRSRVDGRACPRPGPLPAGDVLQADLAVSDEPARLVGDTPPPKLLRAALAQGRRLHGDPAGGDRPQEVGGVGEPHGDLALVTHGAARPDAGGALDGGGVHADVDDSPRRVMLRPQLQVTGDLPARDLVDGQSRGPHEGAGVRQ